MERIGEVEFSMDLEHEQRLTAVEERSKSNSHRLDKVEASTAAINRLATSMEVMASRQEQVADTVDRLDGKVTALEGKPGKRWDGFVEKLIWAVAAAATIGTAAVLGDVNWVMVGSAAALAGVLSLLTSVAGLPELKA